MNTRLPSVITRRRMLGVLVVMCVVLFAVAAAYLPRRSPPAIADPSKVITHSTDTPDETKPDETYQWSGYPDDPRYITLPSIGAGGYIQKVGIDQNQQIAVTTSIYFAGWFVDSAKPGQKGLSIIDGHVTGRQNDGIFKNLAQLLPGETYTLEMGNGQIKTYEVMRTVTVDVNDAVHQLFSQDPKVASQLNLITCGGTFNSATQQYEKRVIVQSRLVI